MSLLRIVFTENKKIITIIIQNQFGAECCQITVWTEAVMPWERLLADRNSFDYVLLDRGLLDEPPCRTKIDPATAGVFFQITALPYVI
jgi:hypothetical protein